jgi:hypothetical protein
MKRKRFYTEKELDFIFLIFCFVATDDKYETFGLRMQTQAVFSSLIEIYCEKSFWESSNKCKQLCAWLFEIVSSFRHSISRNSERINGHAESNGDGDASETERQKDYLNKLNDRYHLIVYLTSFFETSSFKPLRDLSNLLSLVCAIDLLSSEKIDDQKLNRIFSDSDEYFSNVSIVQ